MWPERCLTHQSYTQSVIQINALSAANSTFISNQNQRRVVPEEKKKIIVSDLRSAEVKAKFQAGLHSLLHSLKRTRETPSKTNDRGGKLKLLPPLKTQTCLTCADTAWGPAYLASASSATNGPSVGVDNNPPDPRSRSQAKQSLSSILVVLLWRSWRAGSVWRCPLPFWRSFCPVGYPSFFVFLFCRIVFFPFVSWP